MAAEAEEGSVVKKLLQQLKAELVRPQARPTEIAIAKLILGALGVKLGINFGEWLKAVAG